MSNENQFVLKLKVNAETSHVASNILREVDGVDSVEQVTPQYLRITYDINRTSWGALRERLQAEGAYCQAGLLARWRDAWREFREQNTRDNLRHTGACCSKPPTGAGSWSRGSRHR